MYRCISNITIVQKVSVDFPSRSATLNFNFVNEFESSDSWRDLTNKGKLILPKNLYYRDQNNKLQPLKGTNINMGGFSSNAPLLLRGDSVTIIAGYKFFDPNHREIEITNTMFTGYITKVHSKIPIEIELQDNMYLLKQTPMAVQTFRKTNTLEDILKTIVAACNKVNGTSFTTREVIKDGATKTYLNVQFPVVTETAAEVLYRLQKTFGLEFYFRGNELRGGTLIYIESEAKTLPFEFQKNIISDELEYSRKEDVKLSCIARNTITVSEGVCKDGTAKTKRKRLEVLVTIIDKPTADGKYYLQREIKIGDVQPQNNDGERHDFHGLTGTTIDQLAANAYEKLKIYYYTGFKGTFTTFGLPFIRQGDNVTITDPILPERNGTYKVKEVDYKGGVAGLRQTIKLDFKFP